MRPLDLEQQLRDAIDHGDTAEISRLGNLMDAEEQERRTPTMLASALWYAEQGLRVFPLQPGAKIPHKGFKWRDEATDAPDRIREWWTTRPDANLAVATGHTVDVIDVDGPVGVVSWARMRGLPPALGRVSTPRPGGNHIYIAASGRGNRAGVAPGVDYRGLGGYVVAPPSVNSDGKPYVWTSPLDLTLLAEAV